MLEKLPQSIGEGLHDRRAGLQNTVFARLGLGARAAPLKVRSSAFDEDKAIPVKYTSDGAGVSPPLEWRGVPETATRVVVIVEDADSPTPHPLVHAIVVNLDVRDGSLIEGALNSPDHDGVGLQTGQNSYLMHAWLPPDPPPGHGIHRYLFQVFALRDGNPFSNAPGRTEVFDAIKAGVVAAGCTIGTYERAVRVPSPDTQETAAMPVVNALA
jgi:Raf kinase inhibitor-like YbhB/YbcL family protein